GFFLPIMFGALVDLTGVRSSVFMLMFGVVWVSLVWMYWTEVRPMKAERHELYVAKKAAEAAE
ncbi:MAG: MFS transporter, partial [Gammaproteobacteria bacterium]